MTKNITAAIDLGNQSCILAIHSEHGVDIVLNESSNRKTPTIVGYQEGRRTAGEFAQQQHMMNIQNTITQLKCLIGLPFDSKERETISNSVPYKIVRLDNGLSGIELDDGQVLRIEQIIGYYLKSLLEILQKKNPKIEQIVLTVPSSWTEIQRRSILNAASISNVKIAGLLDSSIASAIAYVKIHGDRFPEEKEKALNVLFIEFGDTSMEVSVGLLSKNTVEIKSNISDQTLGGQHFTDILEKYLIEKVSEKYKIDPRSNKRSMIRFKQAVEKVKKTLSSNPVVLFEIPSLMNDIDISMTVKREEFNDLIKEEIQRIRPNIEEALKKANITKEQISFVEIVGGSSRIASIKAEIKEIIGSEAKMSLDLDECFAIGAGFMASKIDGNDIGVDIINKKCSLNITAKNEDDGSIVTVFSDDSLMPSTSNIKLPISKKQDLTFLCNNSPIGIASIETGVDEKVNAEIDVSIDSFGLISIKDAKYRMIQKDETKSEEENKVENKTEEETKEVKNENKSGEDEIKEEANIEEEIKPDNEIKEEPKIDEEVKDENKIDEESKSEEIKDEKLTEESNEEVKGDENKNDSKEEVTEQHNEEEKSQTEITQEKIDEIHQCTSFTYTTLMTLTQQEISEFQKVEEEQNKQDKLQLEIDNTKNELESQIFSTKNELRSIKNSDQEGIQSDIEKMKEKLESIHNWFSENEFERLSLDEYKSKINEISEINKSISEHHLYESKIEQIVEIKQKLESLQEKVKKDENRLQFEESVTLQSLIPKQIESIDELLKLPKESIVSFDINDIKKELKDVESKFEALQAIPVIKKRRVRRRKNNRKQMRQNQFDRTWSPFGMGGGFFDDFMNADPWQSRRNNFYGRQQQQEPEDEYEYAYEYETVDEKDKRPLNKNKNGQRRKSSSSHQNVNEEQLIKESQKQEYLRRQEHEEQLRRQKAAQIELENRRRQQQIEQEEQMRRQRAAQIEMENRRRQQQIEQEEQLRRQRAAQIEMENRRRQQQIEQEKMRRAKESERMQRERSMNDSWSSNSDPWSSPFGYPFGRTSNPQRQTVRPRQQQQRRGYGYPWGF